MTFSRLRCFSTVYIHCAFKESKLNDAVKFLHPVLIKMIALVVMNVIIMKNNFFMNEESETDLMLSTNSFMTLDEKFMDESVKLL